MTIPDKIVQVDITKKSAQVSRTGFGTAAVLGFHTKFPQRSKKFVDADAMLTVNGGDFIASDPMYLLASAISRQQPSITEIVCGRRVSAAIRKVTYTALSGTIAGIVHPKAATVYSITIARDGLVETFDHLSVGPTPTPTTIATALVALINVGTIDVLATDNTGSFSVETAASPGGAATAGVPFVASTDKRLMSQVDETIAAVGESMVAEISALRNSDDSWYALIGDFHGKVELEAAGLALESLKKIHLGACADDDIYDAVATTDTASTLQDLNLERTALDYHEEPELGIAGAQAGRNLPEDPGSITWAFQVLAGVKGSELNSGEDLTMDAKRANYYTEIGGEDTTLNGITGSGFYLDTMRGVDKLEATMNEEVYLVLKSEKKVEQDDGGLAKLENAMRVALQEGVDDNFLLDDFTITIPKASDITPSDRTNRIARNLEFSATGSSAVQSVKIKGTVSV